MLAGLGAYNLNTMSDIRDRASQVETNILPSLMNLADLNLNVTRLRVLTLRLMLTTDIRQEGETLQLVENVRAEVKKNVSAYESVITLAEERQVFNVFKKAEESYLDIQQQVIDLLKQDETGEALDLLPQMNGLENTLTQNLLKLTSINQQSVADSRTASIAAYESAKLVVIALIALAVITAIAIALMISKSINQPLSQVIESAQFIANSDLTRDVCRDGNDELTKLAQAISQMQTNLREAIGHISSSASQLASAAEELNAVTDES
ncbi:methyl-accepting chemotaxis protein, partial [Alishewanella sp. SMS9]|nr:methyl-accepting chemotaxis protein [Alishewanella sp. SMS9]